MIQYNEFIKKYPRCVICDGPMVVCYDRNGTLYESLDGDIETYYSLSNVCGNTFVSDKSLPASEIDYAIKTSNLKVGQDRDNNTVWIKNIHLHTGNYSLGLSLENSNADLAILTEDLSIEKWVKLPLKNYNDYMLNAKLLNDKLNKYLLLV